MSNTIHENDIGTAFTLNVTDENGAVDLTTAQVIELWFQRPDNTTFSKPCYPVNLATGQVQYTTRQGDLNQAGKWKLQVVVQFANGTIKHSSVLNMMVAANISLD